MPSSRGSPQPRDGTQVSHTAGRFFTIWATREAQEHWSGHPNPPPGDAADPGIKLGSPAQQAGSLQAELPGKPLHILHEWVSEFAQSCQTLCDPMDSGACTRLHCPWDFLGKSTGVGCRFLLQGIFPTQGLNPGLLHCRQMLYHLSHQGSQIFFISIPK